VDVECFLLTADGILTPKMKLETEMETRVYNFMYDAYVPLDH